MRFETDVAFLARKIRQFMKKKKKFSKKKTMEREIDSEKEKELIICYECKKLGHLRYDCSLIKSSERKKMKKALFGAWTDNESSSSSSDGEEHTNTVNFCLMALEDEKV